MPLRDLRPHASHDAELLDEVDAVVRLEVEARPETPYERWPGWPQAGYLPRYEVSVR